MLQLSVIGNLGRDAEVKETNGRKYVSFTVAHSDVFTDSNGQRHENTQWVSCILNGDGGSLLQYLTKGKKVYVSGDGSARVYSSKVQRQMVAGLDLNVRVIELIGGSSDEVPRQLVGNGGVLLEVHKSFWIDPEIAKNQGADNNTDILLQSVNGATFRVNCNGYVTPESSSTTDSNAE